MKHRLLAAALLACSFTPAVAGDTELNSARERLGTFYEGDPESFWAALSDELRALFGSLEGLTAFRAGIDQHLGPETEVLEESSVVIAGVQDYSRIARHALFNDPIHTHLLLQQEQVVGFSIAPLTAPAVSAFEDYRTRIALRLPFEGEWLVFWGGRSVPRNYHAAAPDQRFAYDFVVARDGRTHRGDGRANEDYFCFGLPILAPADGVVVRAVDGHIDQTPGHMEAEAGAGNYVVIDHGQSEYSFLAHLQHGSVTVEVGQIVGAGEPLGACGNSGHSSEPHLHFHLQRDPQFHAGLAGEGLPAQFIEYIADGEPIARGEPWRGQVIRPRD